MANYNSKFKRTSINLIFCIFLICLATSCASVDTNGDTNSTRTALSYIQPLINEGVCGEGKGVYRKIKNTHNTREIVATIKTDMSPDPNNWYPSKRDFNLKPNQLRILGCSVVDEGPGKEDSRVSHSILGARFK